jgi:O-antigen/teichoic acid export membrane protein
VNQPSSQWSDEGRTVVLVAHNISTRYLAYLVDAVIGLVMLPFNLHHLGMAAYGVWMLTTSLTVYFGMLDMGYGGALVRFVARYRAKRDAEALNEVLSTISVVYTAIGVAAYLLVLVVAFNLTHFMKLTPDQIQISRALLLIIGANVSARFIFGVYGGVIVGFQRYHLNNITSIGTSIAVAAANVIVLISGFGLVPLVAATTAVRIAALLVYRLNAYRVYPGLRVNWAMFKSERLREVSGFSVYMLVLDGAYKLNYSTDVLVIGAFIGAPAVALWSPAQRLVELMLRLSNQLSDALFPIVVDCDTNQSLRRLQRVFVQGTRLSLATAIPIAGGCALLSGPLLTAWLGPAFTQTAIIAQILAVVVIIRVGSSTASVILKGAGLHRRLTALIAIMGIGNLGLSVALIPSMGLTGVAVGTLIPVAGTAILGLFPTACRRVGIPVLHMLRHALWPALWPAAIAGSLLIYTRDHLPATLPAVGAQLVLGGLTYGALFLVAIGRAGREEYLKHAWTLIERRSGRMSRVGTANAS